MKAVHYYLSAPFDDPEEGHTIVIVPKQTVILANITLGPRILTAIVAGS
jgi:hypothetical protein